MTGRVRFDLRGVVIGFVAGYLVSMALAVGVVAVRIVAQFGDGFESFVNSFLVWREPWGTLISLIGVVAGAYIGAAVSPGKEMPTAIAVGTTFAALQVLTAVPAFAAGHASLLPFVRAALDIGAAWLGGFIRRQGKGRKLEGLLVVVLSLTAFAVVGASSGTTRPWRLQSFGSLRAMMHENRTEEAVHLKRLLPNRNLYAVGALSGLRGEVTIAGGVLHVAYPDESGSTKQVSEEGASLLVTAEVTDWIVLDIAAPMELAELDTIVASYAGAIGLDTGEAFPFLIDGTFEDLSWHVIDGRRLAGGGGSHSAHREAAVKHRRDSANARLVAFYSPRDHGVFTHVGSKTHVHAILANSNDSGHVDSVSIPAGARLSLPDPEHDTAGQVTAGED